MQVKRMKQPKRHGDHNWEQHQPDQGCGGIKDSKPEPWSDESMDAQDSRCKLAEDRPLVVSMEEVRSQLALNLQLLDELAEKRVEERRKQSTQCWLDWRRIAGKRGSPVLPHNGHSDSDIDRLAYALQDSTHALEEVACGLLQLREQYEGEAIEEAAALGMRWAEKGGWEEAIFWDEGRYAPLVGMIERLQRQLQEEVKAKTTLAQQKIALERQLQKMQQSEGMIVNMRRELQAACSARDKIGEEWRKLQADMEKKDIAWAFAKDAKAQAEKKVVNLTVKCQKLLEEKEMLLAAFKQAKQERSGPSRRMEDVHRRHKEMIDDMSALAGECERLKQVVARAEEEKRQLRAHLRQYMKMAEGPHNMGGKGLSLSLAGPGDESDCYSGAEASCDRNVNEQRQQQQRQDVVHVNRPQFKDAQGSPRFDEQEQQHTEKEQAAGSPTNRMKSEAPELDMRYLAFASNLGFTSKSAKGQPSPCSSCTSSMSTPLAVFTPPDTDPTPYTPRLERINSVSHSSPASTPRSLKEVKDAKEVGESEDTLLSYASFGAAPSDCSTDESAFALHGTELSSRNMSSGEESNQSAEHLLKERPHPHMIKKSTSDGFLGSIKDGADKSLDWSWW